MPILLGLLLLTADVPDAERLYGIVVIGVIFSVVVQGSLVPTVARRLGVPMQPVRPEPGRSRSGLRLNRTLLIRSPWPPGSVVDGRTVDEVANLVGNVLISMVVRDGVLLPAHGDTRLQAGDLVTLLIDEDSSHEVACSPSLTANNAGYLSPTCQALSQESPKRAMGSVASAQSSASAAARRDLRRANKIAPPATAPTASTTFHFTRSTIAALIGRDRYGVAYQATPWSTHSCTRCPGWMWSSADKPAPRRA